MSTDGHHSICKVGIIGAGAMGGGIAQLCTRAHLQVRLFDECPETAASVIQKIQSADVNAIVCVAMSEGDFADVDLLVEAVPEKLELKTDVLSRFESSVSDQAIIASNSSSLSIAQLSTALHKPDRFCGLHFCHPVNKRPLVEVVSAVATNEKTTSRAYRFAQAIGMSPIRVTDSPGFLLNRLLVPYMNETLELLLYGADVKSLDRAAKEFGMLLRPLDLFDHFGFDVALAVGRSLYQAYPARIAPSELLIAMYKSGRRGRKSGGGFYATAEDAEHGRVDADVLELIEYRRRTAETIPDGVVAKRLFLPMLLEATRVLEECYVPDAETIDTALRDGLGMTENFEGLIHWGNSIGASTLVDCVRQWKLSGEQFEPTQMLLSAADNNALIGQWNKSAA